MSSTRVPKRVVVAFLRVDDLSKWAEVLSARDRFDPLAPKIAAHITLVSPFEDPASDAVVNGHIRTAISGVSRFSVTLGQVTVHEGEYLFLNVKRGNDQIVHLRDALYSGLLAPHLLRTYTFVPHVTVGRVTPGDLTVALDRTSSLTAIRADVHAASVYEIKPDGTRPILFDVPLLTVGAG